jgi:catechol 2,3-dioxygenase-like lactoylglutathione lyase family enzyme
VTVHTILYVADQEKSRDFYKAILNLDPILDVPGMTEFQLSESHILGLMPEKGIKKLLGEALADPTQTNGISRAELYFRVSHPEETFSKALSQGAKKLSPVLKRDWGDHAGYVMDPDGHVLAFSSL